MNSSNLMYLSSNRASPSSPNQSCPIARWACGESDLRHQPLPLPPGFHASLRSTPRLIRNRAMPAARLHCLSFRHRILRRIHASSSRIVPLACANRKQATHPHTRLLSSPMICSREPPRFRFVNSPDASADPDRGLTPIQDRQAFGKQIELTDPPR